MIGRMRLAAAALLAGVRAVTIAVLASVMPASASDDPRSVSPYAATPETVVQAMLRMAEVGPRDYVIDLGSGDGRMVIAAVADFGARGLGVDIDAKLVDLASRIAARDGVADRARFREQDLFETDLSQATVITVYLLPAIMDRIARKLRTALAPGTRVVTHDFPLPGWPVQRVQMLDVPEKRDYQYSASTTLYLYRVPEKGTRW